MDDEGEHLSMSKSPCPLDMESRMPHSHCSFCHSYVPMPPYHQPAVTCLHASTQAMLSSQSRCHEHFLLSQPVICMAKHTLPAAHAIEEKGNIYMLVWYVCIQHNNIPIGIIITQPSGVAKFIDTSSMRFSNEIHVSN